MIYYIKKITFDSWENNTADAEIVKPLGYCESEQEAEQAIKVLEASSVKTKQWNGEYYPKFKIVPLDRVKPKIIKKKILPDYYEAVIKNIKKCELRKDDSDYEVGDILILQEYDGEKYTGRETTQKITYIMRNMPEYGLKEGYAILCIEGV